MNDKNDNLVTDTVQGTQSPCFTKRIGKTTYTVTVHFSQTSKETMTDKIKRLIQNDCQNMKI